MHMKSLLLILIALTAAFSALAGEALPTVSVTRFDDAPGTCDGTDCTLRQAAAYIDGLNLLGTGVISLPEGNYSLSIPDVPGTAGVDEGSIKINARIEIRSEGDGSTIDAMGNSRHFDVASDASLVLKKLSLRNGRPADRTAGANGTPGSNFGALDPNGGNGQTSMEEGKHGGSIFVGEGAFLLADEVFFRDNQAGKGADGGDGGPGASVGLRGRGGIIGGGVAGDGGRGAFGTRGGCGGAVFGDVDSTLVFRCCAFTDNMAGEGGAGGRGGNGGTSFVGAGDGGDGGPGGTGGNGGTIDHRGELRMTQCLVENSISGNGGDGGDGGDGFGFANGGDGARGGSAGSGGAISLAYIDDGEQHLSRCNIERSRTGQGGNGGGGGDGGAFNDSSGGDGGRSGQGGLMYSILARGPCTIEDSALISGSIGDRGLVGKPPLGSSGTSGEALRVRNAGGGLYVDVDMDISRSSITSCRAIGSDGGGIYHQGETLRLASCTLANNEADQGGALYGGFNLYINHGTIVGNEAESAFGAIAGFDGPNLRNTLIANNTSPVGTFDVEQWRSDGFNILDNADAGPRLFTDFVGPGSTANVMLPALTPTFDYPAHFKMPNASQAVDFGSSGFPSAPLPGDLFLNSETDILGMPRQIGSSSDIGSVENASSLQVQIQNCQVTNLFGTAVFQLDVHVSQTPLELSIVETPFAEDLEDARMVDHFDVIPPEYRTANSTISRFEIIIENLFPGFFPPDRFYVVAAGGEPPLGKFAGRARPGIEGDK